MQFILTDIERDGAGTHLAAAFDRRARAWNAGAVDSLRHGHTADSGFGRRGNRALGTEQQTGAKG